LTDLLVHPATQPLTGSVPVPSDKSIGHRALMIGALAAGAGTIRGFSRGEDNVATLCALRAMGVRVDETSPTELVVHGGGLHALREPRGELDCGNSGTTMRLLAGLLAAQPFKATLIGDASLSRRPMMRVLEPLRARGARIDGRPHPSRKGDVTAPLTVSPAPGGLGPLEHRSAVASAQVKSAVLLSGLYARGATYFHEPVLSRDHTERMLRAQGAPLRTSGSVVEIDPAGWDGRLAPLEVDLPGDLSAAAFLLVAAQIVGGSRVTVRDVGTNPTRTGLLEIARDMGAGLAVEHAGDRAGEPVATIHAWSEPLRATAIGGELVPRGIDEIPIACALAARAVGTTRIADAEELRVKESDRIATMASVLRAFGVTCEERPDGLVIEGRGGPLEAVDVTSGGDHRIAMTAAVLALVAKAPCRVRDADCIATSFPRFVGTLRALGAHLEVLGADAP
jgi:3-phosphoshikimate 1-carboxyvinyltransferase